MFQRLKNLLLIPCVLALVAGCETTRTLEDNTSEAVDTAVNPERREIHYIREGNTIHYRRVDCSGRLCNDRE